LKFGPLPTHEAEGAILAHSVKLPDIVIKKGARLSADHIAALSAGEVGEVICARLEPGDIHEDEAAERIARLAAGPGIRVDAPFTGRCNLYAEQAGVLQIDEAAVNRLNRIDPGLTFATLPAYGAVEAGRMIATAKIIPFALPGGVLDEAGRPSDGGPILKVAPFQLKRIGLIQTELSNLKPSILDKTRKVTDARLAIAGASVVAERRVPHDSASVADAMAALAGAGAEMILIFGASAIIDSDDVIPTAIRRAGGSVIHFGMPVDPGNLLLTGAYNGLPVIGSPGCARSPKENGFDWILNRLLAKFEVVSEDITGLGVGGLLMEIISRPQPRDPVEKGAGPVAALILAAGQSRRMGRKNKLLARFDGEQLIRRSVRAALASKASPVIVVTGHMEGEIRAALDGLDVTFAHNADFAEGLSSSLKRGMGEVPGDASGALVMLADMPGIDADALNRLLDAFDPQAGRAIILPTAAGKRGNPVIWARDYFAELQSLSGDTGARHLLASHEDAVCRVEIGGDALLDVDTPEALSAAGGRFPEAG
jgi:molybdenum cofactor cytidylyltransferase